MKNELNFLSTRSSFNFALNHFKFVTQLMGRVQKGMNLADILNEAINSNTIKPHQLTPILNVALVDKFKYLSKSINLKNSIAQNVLMDKISRE